MDSFRRRRNSLRLLFLYSDVTTDSSSFFFLTRLSNFRLSLWLLIFTYRTHTHRGQIHTYTHTPSVRRRNENPGQSFPDKTTRPRHKYALTVERRRVQLSDAIPQKNRTTNLDKDDSPFFKSFHFHLLHVIGKSGLSFAKNSENNFLSTSCAERTIVACSRRKRNKIL